MRNVSDKGCTETQNTHFVFSNFFSEKPAVYEIMWKNIVERDRPHMNIRRMRIACWIRKATNTHLEYVILIVFSTDTMVALTHLIVTLYVHCIVIVPNRGYNNGKGKG
jgi:hypothetical protein